MNVSLYLRGRGWIAEGLETGQCYLYRLPVDGIFTRQGAPVIHFCPILFHPGRESYSPAPGPSAWAIRSLSCVKWDRRSLCCVSTLWPGG